MNIYVGAVIKLRNYYWWDERRGNFPLEFYQYLRRSTNIEYEKRGRKSSRKYYNKDYFDDFFKDNGGKVAIITKIDEINKTKFTTDIDDCVWLDINFIDSIISNAENITEDMKSFCNKFCILDCNNICPLFKYRRK